MVKGCMKRQEGMRGDIFATCWTHHLYVYVCVCIQQIENNFFLEI
jgi:hypothetical protein